jgi:hypothetical protein
MLHNFLPHPFWFIIHYPTIYWYCQWLRLQHLTIGWWVTNWKTSVTTVWIPAEIWTQYWTQVKPEPTCLVTAYVSAEQTTPWPESVSDHHLSKLVPTFADRGCHVVSVTDPYGRILGFIDRIRYFPFQVAPQLCSRSWVDPVPNPLLIKKSGRAGNQTRTSGYAVRNSDH